jgi:putative thioredoxin
MSTIAGLDSPYIVEGTRANFDTLALENSQHGPVLVNFWSPRAGPCLRLYPVLDKLIHEYGGKILLVNLNTDEHRAPASAYGVTSVPTLKLFRHREPVETLHGYQNESQLRQALDRHVARASDQTLAQALEVYQGGDAGRAFTMLADAALEDPQNLRIPLTLAKLLLREQRHEDAHRLLEALPGPHQDEPPVRDLQAHLGFLLAAREAPDEATLEAAIDTDAHDLEARYRLCARRLVDDDFEGAMAQLLEILRRDPGFRHGAARKGLLALFDLLGDQDERVVRYRREMNRFMH